MIMIVDMLLRMDRVKQMIYFLVIFEGKADVVI